MAGTNKVRWSYSAGERGRNRVRVYEHASGALMLEVRDRGRRKRISLGHRDRERAKQEADRAAARLGGIQIHVPIEEAERADLTLEKLFDIYGAEVTPTKGARTRKRDREVAEMFTLFFGSGRTIKTLSVRDRERFIRDRRAGRVGPGEPPWRAVSDRTVEADLRFILAVFNWATVAGDGRGGVLLDRNPFKGFKVPKEKNPRRVTITDDEYKALLAAAEHIDWRFHVALVLAHETGHRIGAIRKLRWSDVDLEDNMIRWRAETEKTGYEHVTPMTPAARAALSRARDRNPGIGDAPILPSPGRGPNGHMSRYLARDWWNKAEKLAGLEPKKGRGWHSLRRKFASDLKGIPLKTLCKLGGWKTHVTVLTCYQSVDENEMREALEKRRLGT